MNNWLWLILVCSVLGSVPANAAEYVVQAWYPMTGAQGTGKGESLAVARDAAYYACVANGGVPKCCAKHNRQMSPAS